MMGPDLETMVKANELGMVLLLQAEEEIDLTESCSCCGSITAKPLINPRVIIEPDRWVVAFICPKCEDETNETGGANIKRVSPIYADLIDPTLLAAYKWLDTKLLQRNQNELFIRRPTFAEVEEARAAGVVLPANFAVVVSPCGERGVSRRLLPFPFPWLHANEWRSGPIAAQSALDFAAAIERGEKDMWAFRSKAVFSASTETMARLMRS